MAKEKKKPETNEEEQTEEVVAETVLSPEEIAEITEKAAKCDEYLDKYQRTLAEYDNFRKRTVKEKEQLITEAKTYTVSMLLPVIDNLERAEVAAQNESDDNPLKTGVEMIMRSLKECFEKLGVEEIEAQGKPFDPNFHNAVMHVEDEEAGENTVVEVFQKGYKTGDKVLRPSIVKVAN